MDTNIGSSQPLFFDASTEDEEDDDNQNENKKETDKKENIKTKEIHKEKDDFDEDKSNEPVDAKESEEDLNITNHWLFATRKGPPPSSKKSDNATRKLSVENLNDIYQSLVNDLNTEKKKLKCFDVERTIPSNYSTLASDDVENLFKNDRPQYKRIFDPKLFTFSKNVTQMRNRFQTTLNGINYNVLVNSFAPPCSRPHLSREAKMKDKIYTSPPPSDEEDFDDFMPSRKKVKKTNDGQAVNGKSTKTLSTKAGPSNASNSQTVDDNEINEISLISDDEDSEPIAQDDASKGKIKGLQQTAITTISEVFKNPLKSITGFFAKQPLSSQLQHQNSEQNETHNKTTEETVSCPMCNKDFSMKTIEDHAFLCQGPAEPRSTRANTSRTGSDGQTYVQWDNAWKESNNEHNSSQTNSSPSSHENPLQANINKNNANYKTSNSNNNNSVKNRRETSQKNKQSTSTSASKKGKKSPMATTNNNNNNGFTKLKEDKKRKRKCVVNPPPFPPEEEEEDVFNAQGYTTIPPLRSKKPTITYGRQRPPRHFFDQSQENDDFKCGKCDKMIPTDKFEEHTNACLSESITIC